jgi:hypothetical protein
MVSLGVRTPTFNVKAQVGHTADECKSIQKRFLLKQASEINTRPKA